MVIYHLNENKDLLEDLNLNEKPKQISEFINRQLSANNLAIFIGSGCSTGAIPLMSTTMRNILEEDEYVLKYVKKFLNSKEIKEFKKYLEELENKKKQDKEIEIEIDDLQTIMVQLDNKNFSTLNDYMSWLDKQASEDKQKIFKYINWYYFNYSNIEEFLNWIQNGLHYDNNKDLKYVFSTLKSKFINTIPKVGDNEYSAETSKIYKDFYRYVFEKRTEQKSKVSIFTTNYDLFNEYALEYNNIIYCTGIQNTILKKFDINQFRYRVVDDTNRYKEKWQPASKEANLYKIHGSINWKSNKEGELQQIDFNDEDDQVVIYPTMLKHKETAQAPYSELFREFSNCLQKKDTTLIIIGYGFPDEHINNIIAQNLKNQDFNLIIFGDVKEEKIKNFYDNFKNFNLHIVGGDLDDLGQKAHYFNVIVEEFLKKQSLDNIKGENEVNA
ncbi:SIR2 family protein [Staphylococcus auricularis]|uniref:SIR2 family protein n=1 Tax=Staphylococcus auricularis TaxID=29379 RepID=UPI002DB858C2|nr:SIR2 family protein [Staphylococcus auricularis]MEB6570499.1 SIR2 family protein [Staphylococcus auricularis]